MRALTRPEPGPAALNAYQHGRDRWDEVTAADRTQIWALLMPMQKGLCAYCEASLDQHGRHIDHHRPRGRSPQGTFAWHNLLGACDRSECCGHHKDSAKAPDYELGALVDPSAEDPDTLLIVRDTGRVEPRQGLSTLDQRRATLTIDALQLNLGWKVAERERRLRVYMGSEPDIMAALADLDEGDRQSFVRDELAQTEAEPYPTIIRHFLTG